MNKLEKIADLKARNYEWAIPWEAVEILANAEDCILTSYKCPAGKWTIGWGETESIQPGMTWTKERADERLNQEINAYTLKVSRLLTEYATPNQLGALVSLSYNIGLGAFAKSSVLKAHNKGDSAAASRAFHLWNKARVNGALVPLRGLTARRAAESALYLKAGESDFPETPVQQVEAETPLVKSPINKSSAVTIAAGGITGIGAMLNEAAPVVTQVKEFAAIFSINPLIMLAAVLVGAGAMNMYWRYKQRKDGWA